MATATLTTLTPVHIGNGQKLIRDFDFVTEQGRLGFIDLEYVVKIVGQDQIGQLTALLEKRGSIVEFLRKGRALSNLKIEEFCDRVSSYNAVGSNANELKEHYRTSLKGACIPGSSLKGAIKTAIWENLASADKQASWPQRDYGLVKDGNLVKFFADSIDKKIFGPNANEKTTRFLKIGDIHFPETTTTVYEVGIYNAGFNDWSFKNGQSFLAECIPPGSASKFELKLDSDWFNKNKQAYPEKWAHLFTDFITGGTSSICAIVNHYTSKQLQFELDELKDNGYDADEEGETMLQEITKIKVIADSLLREQANSAIIRVGGNIGWNFTTGGWAKASTLSDTDFFSMRRTIQRGKSYDMDLWPKTRKMTMLGLPFGFVKISLKP